MFQARHHLESMSKNNGITEEILIALRRVIRAIDQHSRNLIQSHGLTGPQALMLTEIVRSKLITGSELAKRVSLSQATVTGILERLEKRGLLSRQRSDRDRRRIMVKITHAGSRILEDAPPLMQETFIERFAGLQEWEQTMILSALQRLVSLMDAKTIQAGPFLETNPINGKNDNGVTANGNIETAKNKIKR